VNAYHQQQQWKYLEEDGCLKKSVKQSRRLSYFSSRPGSESGGLLTSQSINSSCPFTTGRVSNVNDRYSQIDDPVFCHNKSPRNDTYINIMHLQM
jgi:hypothetical protein